MIFLNSMQVSFISCSLFALTALALLLLPHLQSAHWPPSITFPLTLPRPHRGHFSDSLSCCTFYGLSPSSTSTIYLVTLWHNPAPPRWSTLFLFPLPLLVTRNAVEERVASRRKSSQMAPTSTADCLSHPPWWWSLTFLFFTRPTIPPLFVLLLY